jgi:hypothetical protein
MLPLLGSAGLNAAIGASAILFVGFFLALLAKSWGAIVVLIVLSALSIAIPFLGPIILVIGVLLYFKRIVALFALADVIGLGVLLYISPFWGLACGPFAIVLGVSLATLVHFRVQKRYNEGYSSDRILFAMGIAPILIVSLFLPFLDFEFAIDFPETVLPDPSDLAATGAEPAATRVLASQKASAISESANPVEVGITDDHHFVKPHQVSGYWREDGSYVEPLWRDGDGDTSVNLAEEEGGGYIRSDPKS